MTFVLYFVFIIIVQNSSTFGSYASIYNSLASLNLWLNIFLIGAICFIMEYAIKAFYYIFKPTTRNILQRIIYKYGEINNVEHLPQEIIDKLEKLGINTKEQIKKEEEIMRSLNTDNEVNANNQEDKDNDMDGYSNNDKLLLNSGKQK